MLTRPTRPAARRLPTPGALRLRTSSRHAPAIVPTAVAFCAVIAGVSTSGSGHGHGDQVNVGIEKIVAHLPKNSGPNPRSFPKII